MNIKDKFVVGATFKSHDELLVRLEKYRTDNKLTLKCGRSESITNCKNKPKNLSKDPRILDKLVHTRIQYTCEFGKKRQTTACVGNNEHQQNGHQEKKDKQRLGK
eukprot:GAHX01003600.1.p1 GENE.GAHX01003600.1~~GAHX01003600.1.p1  ORF type:complete len:105 (-),score=23.56 GAHX01003600.1:308-622(-)